jgi:hypothetical protein
MLFALVGAAMVVYGLATAASIRLTPWGPRTAAPPAGAGGTGWR